MGAITTKFISDVTTLTAACQTPLNKLIAAAGAFKVEHQIYAALVTRSAARVTQLTGDTLWFAGGASAKYSAVAELFRPKIAYPRTLLFGSWMHRWMPVWFR